jgi:hypothetical protein
MRMLESLVRLRRPLRGCGLRVYLTLTVDDRVPVAPGRRRGARMVVLREAAGADVADVAD